MYRHAEILFLKLLSFGRDLSLLKRRCFFLDNRTSFPLIHEELYAAFIWNCSVIVHLLIYFLASTISRMRSLPEITFKFNLDKNVDNRSFAFFKSVLLYVLHSFWPFGILTFTGEFRWRLRYDHSLSSFSTVILITSTKLLITWSIRERDLGLVMKVFVTVYS